MSNVPELTKGAVKALLEQREIAGPIVQIVEVRKLQKTDRYRVVLSDGDFFCQGMFANQLNGMLNDDEVARKSVVKLNNWVINPIQGKDIVIILGLNKVSEPLADIIGNPQSFEVVSKGGAPAPGQQQQQQQQQQSAQQQQYSAPPRQNTQPQQNYGSSSSSSASSTGGGRRRITNPIASINPYSGDFTIKARVSSRGPMRTWNKPTGNGNLFSVDLIDAEGGEIRATCFNTVADQYFPLFEIGKAFYISKCQIKSSNRKFNPLNHDYELTIDKSSIVEPVEDESALPEITYNYTPIAQIVSAPNESLIDLIAVLQEVKIAVDFTSKAGKPMTRREITLSDDSNGGSAIECTLWGNQAQEFSVPTGSIVLIRRAKVSDYSGKTISVSNSSTFEANPDLKEAHRLRGWFDQTVAVGGQVSSLTRPRTTGGGGGASRAPPKTFEQAKTENIGLTKNESFSIKACIFLIKHDNDVWYPACPQKDSVDPKRVCQKRLFQKAGEWYCEKCATSSVPNFRYMLNFMAVDHTGVGWVTAFNDQGVVILGGQDADTLSSWKADNIGLYEQVFRDAAFRSYRFGITARPHTYQDEARVQFGLNSISPLDFVQESQSLISQIRSYHQ